MRTRVLAFIAVLLGLTLGTSVQASHRYVPRGWGHEQVVHHHVYYPRYRNVYHVAFATDPYAYRAAPRRYYPYYNSAYWRPTAELRFRKQCCRPFSGLPPYYQAWGYPNRHYIYRARYHRRHHW